MGARRPPRRLLTNDSSLLTVTGAARGIGLELVKLYASNPNNIVIAGVRDVNKASSIQTLIDGSEYTAKIHLVKLDAGDVEGNKAAAKEVESAFGKVDILWANAGE
jgi:NAD(P)-dependent dehydrogenase (short-subunit alcohol dehydrogenase family)